MFTPFSKLSPKIPPLSSPPPLQPPLHVSSSPPPTKAPPQSKFLKLNPVTPHPSTLSVITTYIKHNQLFLHPLPHNSSPRRRFGAALSAPPPPPPPQSDPPPGKDPTGLKGLASNLSRLQDQVQIFLAVLFWICLFFWAAATDKRNNRGGRRGKSRFRK